MLLQCSVKRHQVSSPVAGNMYHFTLTLCGRDPQAREIKFLLSARQLSKQRYGLYLDREACASPAARLSTNVLHTCYDLVPEDSEYVRRLMEPGGSLAGSVGRAACGAHISYKLRIRGMMLPRKVSVLLPGPDATSGSPAQGSSPRADGGRGHKQDALVAQLLQRSAADQGLPCGAAAKLAGTAGADAAAAVADATSPLGGTSMRPIVGSPPGHAASGFTGPHTFRSSMMFPGGSGRTCGAGAGGATASSASPLPATKLQNKAPHWNAGLRCWCLNFKGRVKQASVKNFQLIEAVAGADRSDPGRLVLQFGKVDKDSFILDFDPTVLSAVQAFATALTTFEVKFLL